MANAKGKGKGKGKGKQRIRIVKKAKEVSESESESMESVEIPKDESLQKESAVEISVVEPPPLLVTEIFPVVTEIFPVVNPIVPVHLEPVPEFGYSEYISEIKSDKDPVVGKRPRNHAPKSPMYHRTLSYSEYEIVHGTDPIYKITINNEKTVSIFKWVESHYSFQESFWSHSIVMSENKQHFLFICDSLFSIVKYLGPTPNTKLVSFTPKNEMVSIQNDGIGWDSQNNCYLLATGMQIMIHHSHIASGMGPDSNTQMSAYLQLFDSIGMVPLAIFKKDEPQKENIPIQYRKYSVACPFMEITNGESYMYKTRDKIRAFTRSACKSIFDEFAKGKFEPIQVKKGKSIKN